MIRNTVKENTGLGIKRAARILKALKGVSLTGISNIDLAKNLNESPANITRAAQALIDEGMIIKLDNGRYALSIQMLQIATSHSLEISNMTNKLSEMSQRIITGAQK